MSKPFEKIYLRKKNCFFCWFENEKNHRNLDDHRTSINHGGRTIRYVYNTGKKQIVYNVERMFWSLCTTIHLS